MTVVGDRKNTMQNSLKIQDLVVSVDPTSPKGFAGQGKTVVDGISLSVNPGEVHAIMGPNGSGKSSLALTLMGHPGYKVVAGKVLIGSADLLSLKPNERVKKGLFLSFQNPVAVPGVTLGQLIWASYKNIVGEDKMDLRIFYTEVKKQAKDLGVKEEMLNRFVNDGFSGGEKKKAEMLMLLNLRPKFVIFDEIDSGLDVDTLKKIAKAINEMVKKQAGVVLITHNQKILKYIKPNFVHILKEGRLVKSGTSKLASEIEEKGYAKVTSPVTKYGVSSASHPKLDLGSIYIDSRFRGNDSRKRLAMTKGRFK